MNLFAWTLGGLSVAVLMAAAALWSGQLADWHLVGALVVAGVITDWLPIRWMRKGETWVVHAAGGVWVAAALALLSGPAFVVVSGVIRCVQMLLKSRFSDGVSRANYDTPRVAVNLALVVLPATVAAPIAAVIDMPIAAGIVGAAVYSLAATGLVTLVVNVTRGAPATDGLAQAVRIGVFDVVGEAAAAVPVILAIQAMGPWLPLLTLSGVVVVMWRQAVDLHTHTAVNTALLDLSAKAADAASTRELSDAVDQAGRRIFGRPVQLSGR